MSYPPPPPPPGSPDPDEPRPEEQPGNGPPQYEQPQYGQPYGPPHGPPYGQPMPQTNGKAVAALVVGASSLVLSVCCVGLAGIVAVVLGFKARSEISRSQGGQTGDGLALGGIVTGALGALISLAIIVFLVIAIATGTAEFNRDGPRNPDNFFRDGELSGFAPFVLTVR